MSNQHGTTTLLLFENKTCYTQTYREIKNSKIEVGNPSNTITSSKLPRTQTGGPGSFFGLYQQKE
jgi:hypothetical protein